MSNPRGPGAFPRCRRPLAALFAPADRRWACPAWSSSEWAGRGRRVRRRVVLAAAVGCVGGIYGIGGGSILAPILLGTGRTPSEVAPAALASTFVTSVAGVITFTILALYEHGSVAPDWPTGIAQGVGGRAGAYTGARFQSWMPDALICRLVGILVIAIGAQYLWSGLKR